MLIYILVMEYSLTEYPGAGTMEINPCVIPGKVL